MCNMAAYVGEQQAASVLLRMIGNQEGYGGARFTGIATLDKGKLHYAKVCGDLAELLSRTNAAELPGHVGIVHSRTPGDPMDEWAHPFIANDDCLAYCANGKHGVFADKVDRDALYGRLRARGWRFRTEVEWPEEPGEKRHRLQNGHIIHVSDLMCGFIASKHSEGKSLEQSVREAFTESPSEIAGLCIAPDEPETVTAGRFNEPLMWGRRQDGCYLATTALGFKDEALDFVSPVPFMSTAVLSREGLQLRSFGYGLGKFEPYQLHQQVGECLDALLSGGEMYDIGQMVDAIRPLWPKGSLDEGAMYVYEYVNEMLNLGRVERVCGKIAASLPGHTCPHWYIRRA